MGGATPSKYYRKSPSIGISRVDRFLGIAGFNRANWFVLGFAISFALANPSKDNVYDIMPLFKQRCYAYVTPFEVSDEDFHRFEWHWRNLARFYQKQDGYIGTRLLKSRQWARSRYPYIAITKWATEDSFIKAEKHSTSCRLQRNLPVCSRFKPHLFKIVVDDADFSIKPAFSPPAVAN